MAIIISNDGDKEVGTIADRNAIVNKFDGMQVTVLDAVADMFVGGGSAGYEWSVLKSKWILTWKENKDDLLFVTETKQIVNGEAVLEHSPQSNLIWNAYVINTSNELLVTLDNPNVTNHTVSIGSQNFNGHFLVCTYGYGTVQAAIDGISPTELLNKLITVDGTGSGLDADLLDGHDYQEIVTMLASKTNDSSLSNVAKSGSYTDLSNLPTLPTAVSQLTNDLNYQTNLDILSLISTNVNLNLTKSSISDFRTIVYTPSTVLLDNLPIASVGTVTYLIQAQSGNQRHSTYITIIHDGVSASMNEESTLYTLTNLIDLSCDITDGFLKFYGTTFEVTTTITAVKTFIGN